MGNGIVTGLTSMGGGGGSLTPKIINVAADFPTTAEANDDMGRIYIAAANVTDNDPTKTNTSQSFLAGEEFVWTGLGSYALLGPTAIWLDDGTDVYTINARNIDLQANGLKDTNVTTAILLGDALNTSFSTTNKTIVGAVNEIVAGGVGFWSRIAGTPNYVIPVTAADEIGATGARITKGWFDDSDITDLTIGNSLLLSGGIQEIQTTSGVMRFRTSSGNQEFIADGDFDVNIDGDLTFDTSAGDINLIAATGSLNINNAYTLPTSDGTANYILKTDGLGSVTWQPDTVGTNYWSRTTGGATDYLNPATANDTIQVLYSTSSAGTVGILQEATLTANVDNTIGIGSKVVGYSSGMSGANSLYSYVSESTAQAADTGGRYVGYKASDFSKNGGSSSGYGFWAGTGYDRGFYSQSQNYFDVQIGTAYDINTHIETTISSDVDAVIGQQLTLIGNAGFSSGRDAYASFVQLVANSGDQAGSRYSAYSAAFTHAGSANAWAYTNGPSFENFILAQSGNIVFRDYAANIKGEQVNVDGDGSNLTIQAADGYDSGVLPRNGGTLLLKKGNAVNGGTDGTVDIDELTINSAFTFPTSDGSANQVLKTDGLGVVSWQTDTTLTYWQKIGSVLSPVTTPGDMVVVGDVPLSTGTSNVFEISKDSDAIFSIFTASNVAAENPQLVTTRTRGTLTGPQAGVQNGDVISTYLAKAYTGSNYLAGGSITFAIDGTIGATQLPTSFDISLHNGSSFNTAFSMASSYDAKFHGTGALEIHSGTTAERPSAPINSMHRYNTTTNKNEFYENGTWVNYLTDASENLWDRTGGDTLVPHVDPNDNVDIGIGKYTGGAAQFDLDATGQVIIDAATTPHTGATGALFLNYATATGSTVASSTETLATADIDSTIGVGSKIVGYSGGFTTNKTMFGFFAEITAQAADTAAIYTAYAASDFSKNGGSGTGYGMVIGTGYDRGIFNESKYVATYSTGTASDKTIDIVTTLTDDIDLVDGVYSKIIGDGWIGGGKSASAFTAELLGSGDDSGGDYIAYKGLDFDDDGGSTQAYGLSLGLNYSYALLAQSGDIRFTDHAAIVETKRIAVGAGDDITLRAASGVTSNFDGASVNIEAGLKAGSGSNGGINFGYFTDSDAYGRFTSNNEFICKTFISESDAGSFFKVYHSGDIVAIDGGPDTTDMMYNISTNDIDYTWFGSSAAVMFLDASQNNIGINTTSPGAAYKLDVNGNTRVNAGDLTINGNLIQTMHVNNVSNPPTDAELDAIFGTPATVGSGFTTWINDASANTNIYHIVSTGTSWFYQMYAKAI